MNFLNVSTYISINKTRFSEKEFGRTKKHPKGSPGCFFDGDILFD
jgi:hypothetical protein